MLSYLFYKTVGTLKTMGIKTFYYINKNRFKPEDAIIITGSPRSGTTWLSDIFSAPKEHTPILEPLHLSNPGLKELGFTWRTYIDPTDNRDDVKELFYRIFTGGTATGFNTYAKPFLKVLSTKQWVLKFVRLNRLLPWVLNNFAFNKKPVLIIRHPCGVVYSQMKHPLFPTPDKVGEDDKKLIMKFFPSLEKFLAEKEEVKIRAITWALDNIIPLMLCPIEKIIILSYEKLVLDGERELKRIYSEWGMNVPKEALLHLRKRSREARGWSEFDRLGRKKLGTWKKHLSSDEIKEILRIVHSFGFEEFSEEIEPEYEMLLQHSIHSTKSVKGKNSK